MGQVVIGGELIPGVRINTINLLVFLVKMVFYNSLKDRIMIMVWS